MVTCDGYELILGSSVDAQFGPILLFGLGGQLVEVFKDRALALPPLTSTLARRLMEPTRSYTALQGVRGKKSVDLAALEQLIVRFSQLVVEQPWIKEIDINPLLASPRRLIALDARVVLHDADVTEEHLPRSAIRPYPAQYVANWKLKDGTPVTIRPIRPEDEPLVVKFHQALSENTVYFRYLHMLNLTERTAHERLIRICFNDYDREIALVAVRRNAGTQEILAIGRLIKLQKRADAEFALTVSDKWQGHGLGTELLRRLVQIGRDEKLRRIIADIHPENRARQRVGQKAGFTTQLSREQEVMQAEIKL
jgi:acetyltransferase